jgi:hypothetical protein
MADKSAILRVIKLKLSTSIDNIIAVSNPDFEPNSFINVIFTNFLVFFKEQNGRHSRHLGSDFDEKQYRPRTSEYTCNLKVSGQLSEKCDL